MQIANRLEAVLWDFNGTLLDDVALVVRSVNRQLTVRGLPTLTIDSYREMFSFPISDYYRRIGLNPENEPMTELSSEFHDAYAPGMLKCPLYDGVIEVLGRFQRKSVRQFVLSAMKESLLHAAIEHFGIANFFEAAYGLAHLEADSKISRGRELLTDHRIRPETTLLIGDTNHDAEVADALGISVVLVAQGHQDIERLRETGRSVHRNVRTLLNLSSVVDACWSRERVRDTPTATGRGSGNSAYVDQSNRYPPSVSP